ncbi:MAG: (2Fe-2S)-binding protein [Acidimicrobiales bacterium]
MRIRLVVNGTAHELDVGAAERLLDVLRDRLGLKGAKEGCGRGECGACTVLVDGRPVLACIVLVGRVDSEVWTVEGVADEALALREAFADRGAFQCGFCTPGQVVRAVALLHDGLPDDDGELRRLISGNVCRCTGYAGIVAAIRDAGAARPTDVVAAAGTGGRP